MYKVEHNSTSFNMHHSGSYTEHLFGMYNRPLFATEENVRNFRFYIPYT